LDLAGTNETIGSLAGGGTTGGIVTNSTAASTSTLTTGNASNTTFAGVIQDGSGTVGSAEQTSETQTLSHAKCCPVMANTNVGSLNLSDGSATDHTLAFVPTRRSSELLDLAGTNETIGSLAGGGTTGGIVTNSTAASTSTLTTGNASNTTFAGVIQDGSGTV